MLGTYGYGKLGEALVRLLLRCMGFRILAVRYKSPCGEIDIIARRRDLLRFIEVKTRSSRSDLLYESCSPHQINRIKRAADMFLANYKFEGRVAIDVFYIYKIVFIKCVRVGI